MISVGYDYRLRYEHAQLIMRDYRLGRPYEINLERLSKRSAKYPPESRLESVVTAKIVDGELLLQIKHTLRLLKKWDISLIRTIIPEICPHIFDRYPGSIYAQAFRCCLSHANTLPCIERKKQKHCLECATSYSVNVQTLDDVVTEVQVDVWRCLGSCESPFDSKWRMQANRRMYT